MALAWVATALTLAASPSPHAFLERLCDDFGGRLTGSAANAAAMERLASELRALGLATISTRSSPRSVTRSRTRRSKLR